MRKKKVTNESMMKEMHSLIRWLAVARVVLEVGVGAEKRGSLCRGANSMAVHAIPWRAARGNARPSVPPSAHPWRKVEWLTLRGGMRGGGRDARVARGWAEAKGEQGSPAQAVGRAAGGGPGGGRGSCTPRARGGRPSNRRRFPCVQPTLKGKVVKVAPPKHGGDCKKGGGRVGGGGGLWGRPAGVPRSRTAIAGRDQLRHTAARLCSNGWVSPRARPLAKPRARRCRMARRKPPRPAARLTDGGQDVRDQGLDQ
jgi:hypothetical protein